MAISEIAAALSSLQAAKDIVQTAIGLRDGAAFQTKLIELQSKIIDAQSSASAALEERLSLIEQVRQLKEEIARFETWEAEKQRYQLQEIASGIFVYSVKREAQSTEQPHHLCANCYEDGKKAILQRSSSGSRIRKCHQAKTVASM